MRSGSNLDEYLMIRVAGLVGQIQRGIDKPSDDGRSPREQLTAIVAKLDELTDRQQAIWRTLRGQLASAGIHVAYEERINAEAYQSLGLGDRPRIKYLSNDPETSLLVDYR